MGTHVLALLNCSRQTVKRCTRTRQFRQRTLTVTHRTRSNLYRITDLGRLDHATITRRSFTATRSRDRQTLVLTQRRNSHDKRTGTLTGLNCDRITRKRARLLRPRRCRDVLNCLRRKIRLSRRINSHPDRTLYAGDLNVTCLGLKRCRSTVGTLADKLRISRTVNSHCLATSGFTCLTTTCRNTNGLSRTILDNYLKVCLCGRVNSSS